MNVERAERKIKAAKSRVSRVRGALAALYLRRRQSTPALLAIRSLAAICDMVFFSTELPIHWAAFDPDEKLLWQIAYGLYRQCIATDHRHLIKRVRRHIRVLERCATLGT